MSSRVKPLQPIKPEEFSPKHRLTSKQFSFKQPVPRAKSVVPKTFEDTNQPPGGENEGSTHSSRSKMSENAAADKEEVRTRELDNNDNNKMDNDRTNDEINDNAHEEEERETMPNSAHSYKSSRRSTSRRKNVQSLLDDEEMKSLRAELMESRDFSSIDEDKLDTFIQYMKEYTMFTASQADYEEAKRAKSLGDDASNALYHKKNDREKSDAEKQEFERLKAEKEEKWQNEVDKYDLETNEKLEQLTKHHEEEMNSFDQYWSEEKTLRKYRKPSARLLELWRMEKFLAKQNNFDEAAIVRAESEELSKRELAMGQALANRDYHHDKEKLNEKQENEVANLLQTREHWRDVMLSRQKTEKDVFYNRESVVGVRQKEPLRTREAQLPSKMTKTRSPTAKPTAARLLASSDISFQYCTVLPPLLPPVSGGATQAASENNSQAGSERSKSQSQQGSERNSQRSGGGKNSTSVSST